MKKFINWLSYSSENANRWSLTIKGLAVTVVPIVIALANLTHVQVDNTQVTALFDGIAAVVSSLGLFIGSVIAVIGFARKIISTITGDNAVLNLAPENL